MARQGLGARKGLLLWACLALVLRLGLPLVREARIAFYDERDYHTLALSLLAGRGFEGLHGPTAFRAPGQPAFMALVYAVAGATPAAVHVAQALLMAGVALLAARLGRLISKHPLVPSGAAALVALHPALLYASATLYPTVLTSFLLAAAVVLGLETRERGGVARAVATGSSLGALTLTTPYFALMTPAVLWLLRRRGRWGACLLVALCATAPVGLWMARNAAVVGAPVLTTGGGFNLALGAHEQATPRSGNWLTPPLAQVPDGEVERDEAYRRLALEWMAAHPLRTVGLMLLRAACVLDSVGRPATRGLHDAWLAQAAGWGLLPFVLLGLVGLWLERGQRASFLVAAALGAVVLSTSATLVKPRFRFPCDALLAPLAVVATLRLREKGLRAWNRHEACREPPPCA